MHAQEPATHPSIHNEEQVHKFSEPDDENAALNISLPIISYNIKIRVSSSFMPYHHKYSSSIKLKSGPQTGFGILASLLTGNLLVAAAGLPVLVED